MATRSAIAVMHGDRVKGVYCHWDGYPEGVGVTLINHYDNTKANHLVALGNISSLAPEIGEQHPFSSLESDLSRDEYDQRYGNMTTFYGRDRGEEEQEWQSFASLDEFVQNFEHMGCEYFYVLQDHTWKYTTGPDRPLRDLANDLINQAEAAL
jgi:hypothetical protein